MQVYSVLKLWYENPSINPVSSKWLHEFMQELESTLFTFSCGDYSEYELLEIQVMDYLRERLGK